MLVGKKTLLSVSEKELNRKWETFLTRIGDKEPRPFLELFSGLLEAFTKLNGIDAFHRNAPYGDVTLLHQTSHCSDLRVQRKAPRRILMDHESADRYQINQYVTTIDVVRHRNRAKKW